MSKQKKEKDIYPLYIQSSNPDAKLLKWIGKRLKKGIVYFQSGKPGTPPCGGPGQSPCPE